MAHSASASVTVGSGVVHSSSASVTVGAGHISTANVTVGTAPAGHTATANVTVGTPTATHTARASVTVGSGATGHSASAPVSIGRKSSASVTVSQNITLNPSSIAFAHPGLPTQIVAIQQGPFTGPYTAGSSSTAVTTVAVSGTNLIVSCVVQGSATITVTDNHGLTATLAVSVGAPVGPTVLSSGLLSFQTGGVSQSFTAYRMGDVGPLTITVVPSGVVAVTGSGNSPGPVAYTVSPIGIGNANINVVASDGTYVQLPVSVMGALTAAVTSLRSASTLTVAVSEIGYSGTITPSFIGATSATIAPGVANGPTAVFTLTDTTPGEYFLLSFSDTSGASTTLSFQSKNVSLGPVSFTFFDESSINPVAPGSFYTIYYAGDPIIPPLVYDASTTTGKPSLSYLPPGITVVGVNDTATLAKYSIPTTTATTWGFLGVGGTATISLDERTNYVIVWSGDQAPKQQTQFTTVAIGSTAQSVTVSGYRSPYSSTLGYASQQLTNWTRGWVGDDYKKPGAPGTTGVAYNVAYSFAAVLGEGNASVTGLDRYLQSTSVSQRLLSCVGTQIDSFFADYLGATFKRQATETDFAFLVRGLVALRGEVATRNAVNAATNAAWKSLGNDGTITCEDQTSNPGLMASLGHGPPYFAVVLPTVSVITNAFLLDYRYLGINDYLLSIGSVVQLTLSQVPPLVQQAVESKRALATIPIYAQFTS
jgi:hypothetical protein